MSWDRVGPLNGRQNLALEKSLFNDSFGNDRCRFPMARDAMKAFRA